MAFVVENIIIRCKGCGGRRMVLPEIAKTVRSAEDLIERVLRQIPRCDCGHDKCDVEMRIPPEKQPS